MNQALPAQSQSKVRSVGQPLDPSVIPDPTTAKPRAANPGPSDGKDPIRFQKMTQMASGHPEMERPQVSGAIQEKSQNPNVERVKKAFDKGSTVEAGEMLNLKKEILPGVEEVHDHEEEPIELPSLISQSGVTSGPLPPGALMHKDTHVTLPLTQVEMKQGLHQAVQKSIRWLAEWCVKQLKEAHRVTKMYAHP